MKALCIIASVFFLLFLLLFSRVRVALSYDGRLRLRLSYLFLSFSLYPRRGHAKKPKKKKRSKKEGGTTLHKSSATKKSEKRPLSLSDVRLLLSLFREVLEKLIERSSRHVRLRVHRLHITIGGERDAARAAIGYGVLSQSLSYLIAYLQSTGYLERRGIRDVDIQVKFLSRGHSLDARVDVHCRFLFLVPLLFSTLMHALTVRNRWVHQRTKKNNPSTKETNYG